MVLHECPYCHKLLAAELVSKEQIDARERQLLEPAPSTMVNPTLSLSPQRKLPLNLVQGGPEMVPSKNVEEFLTYKLTYKCKYCGKEWAKLSEKEYDVPASKVD